MPNAEHADALHDPPNKRLLPAPYYDDGTITIYHADCRDLLSILTANLVFADPPYGVGLQYGKRYDDSYGYDAFIAAIAIDVRNVAPLTLITPGIRNLWRWPVPTWTLAWHKPGSTRRSDLGGFNTWEPVMVYGTPAKRLYQDALLLPSVSNLGGAGVETHPCPKPLRLMRWLIDSFSEPRQTILDPFAGSGSTLRAAKDLGRIAVGIEIEERYCEIAARRMAQEVLPFEERQTVQDVLL